MRAGRLVAVLTALGLAACATAPVSNDLSIETISRGQPVPGANCSVQIAEGSFNVVTPAVVPARNTRGDLRVVCDKPGYRTSEVLYRGGYAGYGGYGGSGTSVGFGLGGGGGSIGYGIGLGFPIGGGASQQMPAGILVEMNPL